MHNVERPESDLAPVEGQVSATREIRSCADRNATAEKSCTEIQGPDWDEV